MAVSASVQMLQKHSPLPSTNLWLGYTIWYASPWMITLSLIYIFQQAHALTPLLTSSEEDTPQFPFLTLLVSGGHTLILLAKSPTNFAQLATTADEAIGRTIDKVARDIGLEWSSFGPGAALEKFCLDENLPCPADELPEVPTFPSVMPGRLAFSFSGLHSWVDRYIEQNRDPSTGELSGNHKVALARSLQNMAFKQLEEKLVLALETCHRNRGGMPPLRHVVVSGGVASNALLRQRSVLFSWLFEANAV